MPGSVSTAVRIPSRSKQYVRVPIFTKQGVDLSTTVVRMGFSTTTAEEPATEAMTAAEWEVDNTTDPVTYWAKLLVGPGALVLAEGFYKVWVEFTLNPEVPVLEAGGLLEIH